MALDEVDEEWVRTHRVESLGCKERVCGAASDLCFPHWLLLLHLGALSCLVWLGQVRGWGQGAVGHGHSLQPGLIWHKQDGLALHRALLSASMGSLSSAGNSPARLREVGRGRGAGLAQSPGWPCRQLPAAQSQPNPHSGLAFYLTICFPGSSLLLALGWISQVILSYRASPLWCPLSSIRLGSYLPASA